MSSSWLEFLGTCGAHTAQGVVTDFGDAAAELAAARTATIVSPLRHLGVLEVSGADAMSFLHQQLTSDVKHLAEDAAQHSAWCSAKGRMLASFLVYRKGPAYHLQLSADLLPLVRKRLQMFVLRSKVHIADLSDTQELLGVSGPQAETVLRMAGLPIPAAALGTVAFAAGIIIRLDDAHRFEMVVERNAVSDLWPALQSQAHPVGSVVWQWLEIQAGIPLITERTQEQFVPQMANFEKLGAISFHKGCYPGQEIVARTQYLGKVKRHLYRVHSASPLAAGQALCSSANPEHPCGMIVNAAPAPTGGYDALAIVQEAFAAAGDLELAVPGGARIAILPPGA
ncbi:MAG: folate-binding protein YgfZ [Accumulibacter sp.]|uniref:CAF17-like 4Fe-4S cluster assembly/insertion protein YgfZ n=1 Tax=Accumulibacter sp. TaxID=2053492 RepID=UPI0033145175